MKDLQVVLEIDLAGHFYNHWPLFKIYHNNEIIFDGEIVGEQKLKFYLSGNTDSNELIFVHHGKRFGENNIWDSGQDPGQDCKIKINDIKFDEITIGEELLGNLIFKTDWTSVQLENMPKQDIEQYSVIHQSMGMMNFNGKIQINYTLPILNWLTMAKYKKPITDSAYFSNFSLRWHYDEDLRLIQEIKQLLNIS